MPAVNSPLKIILTAGLLAGCLDIGAAFIQAWLMNGVPPLRVLQYVGSGLLGPKAFNAGWSGAATGALLHFAIALAIAALYFWSYKKISLLRRSVPGSAVTIGTITWLVMNLLIVPSSRVPGAGYVTDPQLIFISWLILVVMIGLPIAYIIKQMSR